MQMLGYAMYVLLHCVHAWPCNPLLCACLAVYPLAVCLPKFTDKDDLDYLCISKQVHELRKQSKDKLWQVLKAVSQSWHREYGTKECHLLTVILLVV